MRFLSRRSRSLLALLAALSFSCSDNQTKPDKKDKKGASSNDALVDGADVDPDQDDLVDGEGDFVEDGEPEEGEITSIEELLKQCGGENIADAKPEDVVYEKTVKSLEVNKTILGLIKVKAQSTLAIKVTGAETTQTTSIVAEAGGALGTLAKSTIDKLTKENSGTTTFSNVPFSDYSSLGGDHKAWEGVLCTFVPATKVVNERGEYETIVEFDPPLPSSVSPRADSKRYEAEIGEGRVFSGIKAIVKQSDNPKLDGVEEIEGEIRIEKVESNTDVTPEGGEEVAITSDIAYKVTYDFGDPEQTFALGLPPEVTYYISTKKHDLVANVVDTKDSMTGVVTFIHEKE